jgi:hypothetical protein
MGSSALPVAGSLRRRGVRRRAEAGRAFRTAASPAREARKSSYDTAHYAANLNLLCCSGRSNSPHASTVPPRKLHEFSTPRPFSVWSPRAPLGRGVGERDAGTDNAEAERQHGEASVRRGSPGNGANRRTADIADRRLYVAIGRKVRLQLSAREGPESVSEPPFHRGA